MSSRYESIFDNSGMPRFPGPRPVEGRVKVVRYDIVLDVNDNPRFMGTPDDILDWFYELGQEMGGWQHYKVLVRRIQLDRYLSLDEYFMYFEHEHMSWGVA